MLTDEPAPQDIKAAADEFSAAFGGGTIRRWARLPADHIPREIKGTATPHIMVWGEHRKKWMTWEEWVATIPIEYLIDPEAMKEYRRTHSGPSLLERMEIQAQKVRAGQAQRKAQMQFDTYGGKQDEGPKFDGAKPVFGQETPYKVRLRKGRVA